MKHIIVGAGIAGVTAAETIKKLDPDAEVVLIGDERFFPYKRYLLTEFLISAVKEKNIFYTSEEFFADRGITFRKGELVKELRADWKSIKFHHGEVMEYDKLLIATGGHPTLGPVLQLFRKNIRPYYTLQDALLLKNDLASIESCVVYGGGLSTLDLMRGLRALGKKVIYITSDKQVKFPVPEDELPGGVQAFLESKGVELITDDRIVSIDKIGDKYHAATYRQQKLVCDAVFAWDGYKPNIGIVRGSEVEHKTGILVDSEMRTTAVDVYAAGDCVEIFHPKLNEYWINFGWPNAMKQGEIAGKNMVGAHEKYEIKQIIPFNLFGTPLKARTWD